MKYSQKNKMLGEDATEETQTDPLEPSHPIDTRMICDINLIAGSLVSKAEQAT